MREDWAVADQELARLVVPRVLASNTVEEMNRVLCEGVYTCFSNKYGTRARAKNGKKHSTNHQKTLRHLRKERNKARNNLRRAKRQGADNESIRELATKFHLLLDMSAKLSID